MNCPVCGAMGGTVHAIRCPLTLAYHWKIVAIFYGVGTALTIIGGRFI